MGCGGARTDGVVAPRAWDRPSLALVLACSLQQSFLYRICGITVSDRDPAPLGDINTTPVEKLLKHPGQFAARRRCQDPISALHRPRSWRSAAVAYTGGAGGLVGIPNASVLGHDLEPYQ